MAYLISFTIYKQHPRLFLLLLPETTNNSQELWPQKGTEKMWNKNKQFYIPQSNFLSLNCTSISPVREVDRNFPTQSIAAAAAVDGWCQHYTRNTRDITGMSKLLNLISHHKALGQGKFQPHLHPPTTPSGSCCTWTRRTTTHPRKRNKIRITLEQLWEKTTKCNSEGKRWICMHNFIATI